jgi:hypothetical protein
VLAALCAVAAGANAAVLCVKMRAHGAPAGVVRVREACRPWEMQLAPDTVGLCCGVSTTTTLTTTTSCPPVTPTTLGIPDCGTGSVCFGLCRNARGCASDGAGGCGCTGPELPCGPVTYNGMCGGTCGPGLTCQLVSPTLPNGCPDSPVCACAP